MLTVQQALTKITQSVQMTPAIRVPLGEALGLVLAEEIVSAIDSPPFDKSMMDGYAVQASDCKRGATLNVVGELTAGQTSQQTVSTGESMRIMTGAPIPAGADAVVPVELTSFEVESNTVCIQSEAPVNKGLNIIHRGLSIKQGETILKSGSGLRAQEIAVLAELGCSQIMVRPQPLVSVLATGDELVPVDQVPGPGQIRNSNALMLAMQARQLGAQLTFQGVSKDIHQDLSHHIPKGLQADFFCLSGGVSAGKLDLVPAVLQELGVQEVFHKVAMKPGKPIWFGVRPASENSRACYVFGLPGNPVSSMVCFELFVRHAVRCFVGDENPVNIVQAQLSKEFTCPAHRETYFPAKLNSHNGQITVTPVNWKGSSDLRSTVDANCSLKIPIGNTTFNAGEIMDVLVWGNLR